MPEIMSDKGFKSKFNTEVQNTPSAFKNTRILASLSPSSNLGMSQGSILRQGREHVSALFSFVNEASIQLPQYTHAEFLKFKQHVLDPLFRRDVRKIYSQSQSNRNIDFDEFARFWNSEVEKQDHAETDSNKRIYYKVPSQLEKHYKKTVARRATRSTVMMGSNAAALEPFSKKSQHDYSIARTVTPRSLL
jgi:hypothetical protein